MTNVAKNQYSVTFTVKVEAHDITEAIPTAREKLKDGEFETIVANRLNFITEAETAQGVTIDSEVYDSEKCSHPENARSVTRTGQPMCKRCLDIVEDKMALLYRGAKFNSLLADLKHRVDVDPTLADMVAELIEYVVDDTEIDAEQFFAHMNDTCPKCDVPDA